MALFNCSCRRDCTLYALIASLLVGIVTAFLQITGVITVAVPFLWVALGFGGVYLGILPLTLAMLRRPVCGDCLCSALDTVLTGLLAAVALAAILLAVGIVATSVISAILVGLLAAALTLALAGTACLVRCLANCDD